MNTQGFIEFIEKNKLPCLIWQFNDCPLDEVSQLDGELSVERKGTIVSAIRCYVILHKEGVGDELIPQNMMEVFENIELKHGYHLTIPILYSEFDFSPE